MEAAVHRFNLWLLDALGSSERRMFARLGVSVLLTLALFGGWAPLGGRLQNGFEFLTAFEKWAGGNVFYAALFIIFGLGLVLGMVIALRLAQRQVAQGIRGGPFYLGTGAALVIALWLLLWSGSRTALGLIAPGLCLVIALVNFLLILVDARLVRQFLDAALGMAGFCFLALGIWILVGAGGPGGGGLGFWLEVLGLLGCGLLEYAAFLQDASSPTAA